MSDLGSLAERQQFSKSGAKLPCGFRDRSRVRLMAKNGWILEQQLFALMALQSLACSPSAKPKIRIDDVVSQQGCIAAVSMGLHRLKRRG